MLEDDPRYESSHDARNATDPRASLRDELQDEHDDVQAHAHGVGGRLRAAHERVRSVRVKRATDEGGACNESGGLSHFLRSLLSGIPWSERAVEDFEVEFDAPDAGRIEIANANGKTRVIGEDRPDILLRGHKNARAESEQAARTMLDAIRVRSEEVAGVLSVEAEIPRKWNRHGSIDFEVRVPRDTEVDISAANGKVCLQGLRHGVRAHSSNGSMRLDDIVGDIDLTTANAKVSCKCTCGRLVARSSNGKIEVNEHRGTIDATTSNGLILATLKELGIDGVTLATSNGRIVLELPEHPDADVDIRVDNGVIRSDLCLGEDAQDTAGRLRGRLGRGGCPIKLRTSNGTISVR